MKDFEVKSLGIQNKISYLSYTAMNLYYTLWMHSYILYFAIVCYSLLTSHYVLFNECPSFISLLLIFYSKTALWPIVMQWNVYGGNACSSDAHRETPLAMGSWMGRAQAELVKALLGDGHGC